MAAAAAPARRAGYMDAVLSGGSAGRYFEARRGTFGTGYDVDLAACLCTAAVPVLADAPLQNAAEAQGKIVLVQLHPTEKVLGTFKKGDEVAIEVMPFRSCMILATTKKYDEPALTGTDYQVVKNVEGIPIEIEILGMPGTTLDISLLNAKQYKTAQINDVSISDFLIGSTAVRVF